jgi:type III secretion protein Q
MLDTALHPRPAPHADPVIFPAGSAQADGAQTGVLAPVSLSTRHLRLTQMVRRGCFVRLPGMHALFSIQPTDKVNADWSDSLFLETPGGHIEIADGARLILGLTGIHPRALPSLNEERGQWFAAALAGRLADTPFAGAQITAWTGRMNMEDSCCLRLTLRSRQHLLTVFARASATTWLDFLSRSAWTFARAPLSWFLETESQETVRVAQHVLPASALRTLALGDVIVPDTPLFLPDGEGRMRLGHLNLRVRYAAPGCLDILDLEGTETTGNSNDESDAVAADQPYDETNDDAESILGAEYGAPDNT